MTEPAVRRCRELPPGALARLLGRYGLELAPVADGVPIPSSF